MELPYVTLLAPGKFEAIFKFGGGGGGGIPEYRLLDLRRCDCAVRYL